MTKENRQEQASLARLLLHSQGQAIQTRDQFPGDEEAPHIAPGWNAVTVQDIIAGMFLLEAAGQTNNHPNENLPKMPDAELEKAMPRFAQTVRKAVEGHIASDRLYTALDEETRDIACAVIGRLMTAEERRTLLNAARKTLKELPAGDEPVDREDE